MTGKTAADFFKYTVLCFCTSAILAQTRVGNTEVPSGDPGQSSGGVMVGTCADLFGKRPLV